MHTFSELSFSRVNSSGSGQSKIYKVASKQHFENDILLHNVSLFFVNLIKDYTKKIRVTPEEYLDKLSEHNSLKLVVVATVVEPGRDERKMYVDELTFLVCEKNCVDIKVSIQNVVRFDLRKLFV